jgi:hypothetical protein
MVEAGLLLRLARADVPDGGIRVERAVETLGVYCWTAPIHCFFGLDGARTLNGRDINGYRRDPLDPFRFTPRWPACSLRGGIAVRLVL